MTDEEKQLRDEINKLLKSGAGKDEIIYKLVLKLDEYYKIEVDKLPCPMETNIAFLWGNQYHFSTFLRLIHS